MAKRIQQKIKNKIIKEYLAGKSARMASEKYGYDYKVCTRELKKLRIKARSPSKRCQKFSQKIKNQMIINYLNGKSLKQIASMLNCSDTGCLYILRKSKIKIRHGYKFRKYTLNEKFFNKIDTEEKAYWLGFISADGNIYKNVLTLILSNSDKMHIKKLKLALKAQHPIIEVKHRNFNYTGIKIGSKNLVNALRNLGVTAKKSLTIKACKLIPKNLLKHYWRGFIDGDGCIGKYKDWIINFVGSDFIVAAFVKWIKSFSKGKAKARKIGKVSSVTFCGNKLVPCIIKALYGSGQVYLNRKMLIAKKAIKLC